MNPKYSCSYRIFRPVGRVKWVEFLRGRMYQKKFPHGSCCWWKKSQTTTWDVVQTKLNWLAGFFPSPVCMLILSLSDTHVIHEGLSSSLLFEGSWAWGRNYPELPNTDERHTFTRWHSLNKWIYRYICIGSFYLLYASYMTFETSLTPRRNSRVKKLPWLTLLEHPNATSNFTVDQLLQSWLVNLPPLRSLTAPWFPLNEALLYPYMMRVRYLLQSYFLASFAFAWSHAVARAGVPWPQWGEKYQAQGADRVNSGGWVTMVRSDRLLNHWALKDTWIWSWRMRKWTFFPREVAVRNRNIPSGKPPKNLVQKWISS